MNRREFVARASALLGVAAAPSGCSRAAALTRTAPGGASPSLGVQLYSLRGLMQQDAERTIAAVAADGFDEVEFAGFYGRTAAEMRRLIDRNGLRSPAGHVTIEDVRGNLPALLRDAHAMEWKWLIVPWIDPKERTFEGYRSLARDLNKAGATAINNGVRIGYHAEDYDFHAVSGGAIPFDILLRETDPALVDFELDTYWVVKGGGDPLRYLRSFSHRFPLLHIKDITAAGQMANAGKGVIDFPSIVAVARSGGTTHFIIENDEPVDPLADVASALAYLKRFLR